LAAGGPRPEPFTKKNNIRAFDGKKKRETSSKAMKKKKRNVSNLSGEVQGLSLGRFFRVGWVGKYHEPCTTGREKL